MFLYTLYSALFCFVILLFFFKNFSYRFCFLLEDFLMPFVIQGLNCLCGFNLTLIFGKHSLYKERKMSRSLLYASLIFCKILILFQSILHNFCVNLLIGCSEILRLILLWNFSFYFVFYSEDNEKMVTNICFHNSTLNFYIIHNSICK